MKDNSKSFMLFGVEYNKEFVYLNDQELRFNGKNFTIEKGFQELKIEKKFGIFKKNFIIFTTHKALQKLKVNSFVKVVENDKGIYIIETPDFRFVNFNKVAAVSKVEKVREKFNIEGSGELELMENFIGFLLKLGVSYKTLSTKWLTGIQREIFYSELSKEDLNFKDKRFNLMRSSDEAKRNFIYSYLKEACEDSGILETTIGEFDDVMSIDMSSMYPFIMVAFKFMVEDPQPYFYKGEPYGGEWDFLPIKFRRHIIEFYRKKEEGSTGKFYKLCLNSLNGKSISEYEVGRDNTGKTTFLNPQHGFQVIEIGRQILEDMTEKLRKLGCRILERDTDSVKFQGNKEKVLKLLEEENQSIIRRLVNSGLSYKEASCGIGQWKFEYMAEKFIQTAPKHYSYLINGEWVVKGERNEEFEIGY